MGVSVVGSRTGATTGSCPLVPVTPVQLLDSVALDSQNDDTVADQLSSCSAGWHKWKAGAKTAACPILFNVLLPFSGSR